MEKINAVLVLLNRTALDETLKNLNLGNVNLAVIVSDSDTAEKTFTVGEKQIPRTSFANAHTLVKKYKDFVWLIGGGTGNVLFKAKKFLTTLGIPEKNIVNFEVAAQVSPTWLANLRHIEENGADFFATGNEYTQNGLDLKYIPRIYADNVMNLGGVCLADYNQDLRQSYLTAKHVFEHVKPGKIKFVLIGLSPDSFHYVNSKDFVNQKDLQYMFALNDSAEENPHAELFKSLFSDDVKNLFATTAQADLNFDAVKAEFNREFSAKSIADWDNEIKPLTSDSLEGNIQILKDYIALCLENGAKPVGVVFPFAPTFRKNYDKNILTIFRKTIRQLEESSDFMCVDYFDHFYHDSFCDMTHLNEKGKLLANAVISMKLFQNDLIPAESFCDMTYDYFAKVSKTAPKEEYDALMEQVFKAATERIRRKDKIKIGFVLYDSSTWCGNDLYDYLVQDERFEVTVFLCLRIDKATNATIREEFSRQTEQFKSHGLNIVAVDDNTIVPKQDLIIYLIPYDWRLPKAFQLSNISAKTLTAYIPYSFEVGTYDASFTLIIRVAWKQFFPSIFTVENYNKKVAVGAPQRVYSGYPKIDIFFKRDAEFQFDWKMARPDAKKIIWAPHHSIVESIRSATFQWNYQFMYEFAKAHPEISWVVKPHSNLSFRALNAKIFPDSKAYDQYFQKWDELPNAKVVTGAYYQAIFATSDGIIHDCGSFTVEYQYVDKPMIYLTREGTKYNELGQEILDVSYLVDGKDFDGIAALIQRVFIEGDDYRAAERKAVFDKYLNYPKANGMLASEFIYKSIADELK